MANILVIDDNPTNRDTYADLLVLKGIPAYGFQRGRRARQAHSRGGGLCSLRPCDYRTWMASKPWSWPMKSMVDSMDLDHRPWVRRNRR